uniref:Uncharacterized protein n=1 Tax=Anguilla anguilla TaxID=7936 RepID=A0A0E9PPZ6_ANGAN
MLTAQKIYKTELHQIATCMNKIFAWKQQFSRSSKNSQHEIAVLKLLKIYSAKVVSSIVNCILTTFIIFLHPVHTMYMTPQARKIHTLLSK